MSLSLFGVARRLSRLPRAVSGGALRSVSTSASQSQSPSPSQSPAVYSLPPLPYDYGALEPAISGQIMETHHKKHHQAYVNNLNAATQQLHEAQQSAAAQNDPTRLVALQSAINFNGGGHLNHSIFWTNLAPKQQGGGSPPTGSLLRAIESDFGSVQAVQSALSAACVGVQGSGWGWLGYNRATGRLQIATKANQDPLLELHPLLGIDVWEHAYYYLYGPARADYLKNIWSVVNWANVQERLDAAQAANKSKPASSSNSK